MVTTTHPTIENVKQEAEKLYSDLIGKGYSIATVYPPYTNEEGKLLFWRVRFDNPDQSKEIRPIFISHGKWQKGEPNAPKGKPLYNMEEVYSHPDKTIWIVEGEKCVLSLQKLGLLATTSGSATSADGTDWGLLAGREVIIWADNDDSGRSYREKVTSVLRDLDCQISWVDIGKLGFADTADSFDWLKNNDTASRADIEALPLIQPEEKDDEPDQLSTGGLSISQTLIELTRECELFTSSDDIAFATIQVNGHYETWAIKSKGFNRWLTGEFFRATGSAVNSQSFNEALSVLEAKARYEGDVYPVFLRMAENGENFYLDLANNDWEVIEVSENGWRVTSNSPVKFTRSSGMLPLPNPVTGGSLELLRSFINLHNDDDYTILISYLLYSFSPKGPYPVLIIQGEQGSAKSTFGKLLRSLIDPSSAPLRATPKGERDLMIAAQNGWLLSYDNLSHLPSWLSDALCRLSTGSGFSTRELYTNSDETIFHASRPVCLNGITEFAIRDDLLDRSLILKLPPIPEDKRRSEQQLWQEFEKNQQMILGAILDGLAGVIKNMPQVKLESHPRMADFARFSVAVEMELGWTEGRFIKAYENNRISGIVMAVEADPVAQTIRNWDSEYPWEGTATDLYKELKERADDVISSSKAWPETPNALGNKLRRIQPSLRKLGIEISFDRQGHSSTRTITIVWENVVGGVGM